MEFTITKDDETGWLVRVGESEVRAEPDDFKRTKDLGWVRAKFLFDIEDAEQRELVSKALAEALRKIMLSSEYERCVADATGTRFIGYEVLQQIPLFTDPPRVDTKCVRGGFVDPRSRVVLVPPGATVVHLYDAEPPAHGPFPIQKTLTEDPESLVLLVPSSKCAAALRFLRFRKAILVVCDTCATSNKERLDALALLAHCRERGVMICRSIAERGLFAIGDLVTYREAPPDADFFNGTGVITMHNAPMFPPEQTAVSIFLDPRMAQMRDCVMALAHDDTVTRIALLHATHRGTQAPPEFQSKQLLHLENLSRSSRIGKPICVLTKSKPVAQRLYAAGMLCTCRESVLLGEEDATDLPALMSSVHIC